MFLKRLEIVGFKSFAERIAVDFVPGVTAVVGPNGSGKSNITDAIRWVLGEQSAKSLRGAKMEDVIFAGSASRKALNFAEVTLVLDNSDQLLQTEYEEVSVTRRVYRSGDSDYLLNRQNCRLKDITELFMDSGLGKEAFSIISQGKVDEILNSKAEDRRAIFEETAGVLKYKQRKKKAEFKLIETDDNLSRVLDILHELEGRIEPLQIQASVAKDYLAFAEELKEREVSLALHDISHQTVELEVNRKEKASSKEEMDRLTKEREQMLVQLKQSKASLSDLELQLDHLQDEALQISATLERQEGRKLVLVEKQNNRAQQVDKLTRSLEVATQELQGIETRVQQVTEQKHVHAQKVKALRSERAKLEQLTGTSEQQIEEQIEQLKSEYIELLNEEAALKNEQRILLQQNEKQLAHIERFSQEVDEIEVHLADSKEQVDAVTLEKERIDQELQQALTLHREKKQQADRVTEEYEKKRQLVFDGYQQLHQLRAKRDSLTELEEEFSGYFQGVKELLKQRETRKLSGIHGAVAELFTIPSEYIAAIDTAIGGQAQHVVVESTKDAQQAIAFLKQNRYGRATFLPMEVIKPRHVASHQLQKVTGHPAFIATANDLVTTDSAYQAIRDNLLGTTIVAKDLKGATELARVVQHSYRIVTLDGDVVHPGGSLTGGAAKKQSSVFTRKADLENYTKLVHKLEKDLARAEAVVADLKEQKVHLDREVDKVTADGEQLRQKQQTLHRDLVTASSQLEKWQEKHAVYHLQQQEQGEDRDVASARLQEIKDQLERFAEQTAAIQQQIQSLTEVKTKTVEEKDALQHQLGELLTTIAVEGERGQQFDRDLTALIESRDKAAQQIKLWEDELSWYQTGHDQQTEEELDQEIVKLAETKKELSLRIQQLRDRRMTHQQQIRKTEITEEACSSSLRDVSIRHEKTTLICEQLEKSIHSLHTLLFEEYDLDFEEAKSQFTLPQDSEKERSKIRLLKKSIEELGPVNLSAIEEFEQVNERYQFLTEQRIDLLEAKETLHVAIAEMDEEMTERFSTTFFEIQKHFRVVFRKLFGGGQADLVITEPDNMLETGIEIVAQPPGKKLQNLSLLSGGERALTAIALLFAILQTRPVPFCILDEVEAALDEANVVRYSDYLKQFADDTQFIVITHRKGTMEGADVLYGVTMQESGVSKLVSVKLEDYV